MWISIDLFFDATYTAFDASRSGDRGSLGVATAHAVGVDVASYIGGGVPRGDAPSGALIGPESTRSSVIVAREVVTAVAIGEGETVDSDAGASSAKHSAMMASTSALPSV